MQSGLTSRFPILSSDTVRDDSNKKLVSVEKFKKEPSFVKSKVQSGDYFFNKNQNSAEIKKVNTTKASVPFLWNEPQVQVQNKAYEKQKPREIFLEFIKPKYVEPVAPEKCQLCPSQDIICLECGHTICKQCFRKLAQQNIHVVKCTVKECKEPLVSEYYKKQILDKEFDKLHSELPILEGLVSCPNIENCKNQILFEKGDLNLNIYDNEGNKLQKKYSEKYAAQRAKCNVCSKEFCVDCKSTPYHMGYTCEEWKEYVESDKCRFCLKAIKENNKGQYDNYCNNDECNSIASEACNEYLECNHPCYGSCDESNHLECLHEDCPNYKNIYGKNKDDECEICSNELSKAPCIKADCGHMFHWHCLKKKLDLKWKGPKLIFKHIHCQTCNKELSLSNNDDLQEIVDEDRNLFEKVKEMTMQRLQIEGLDKDPRLKEGGDYFGKPLEFGLFKISYHMCFKCKKPYFAGLRDCINDEANVGELDPSTYICENCSDLRLVAGQADCQTHGKEFIAYKCKFCCSVSSWFCWGNTHFCDPCHRRQCSGDLLNQYEKDKLPKCTDESSCPLKLKHPPNGEEFAIGCTICASGNSNNNNA